MEYMFSDCYALKSLDVSNFDTSKVTNMDRMFYACRELTSLDVSNFDTSKVASMASMFGNCAGLTSLDVSNFNTSNVVNMRTVFYGCTALTELDLSGWDTSKVTDENSMDGMFGADYTNSSGTSFGAGWCASLKKITLGPNFQFVGGADSRLPDKTWYDNTDGTAYSATALLNVIREEARTYTTTKPETTTQSMSILSNGSEISGYSVSE